MSNLQQDLNPRGAYTELAALLRCRFSAQDLKLFAHQPARSLLSGPERTRFRGRGMDFEEVRLYQPGDDIRSIDWRVTARTQVAHTKIFREERERPVFMVVDQRSSLFFGSTRCFKSVLAAHIAALLGWAALANGDRLGALVFGDYTQRDVRPRRSKHAVLELLYQMQDYNHRLTSPITPAPALSPAGQLQKANSLNAMLADARRIAKPGCALFIISDFHDLDTGAEQQLFELARHTDVTLIHVYDQLERQLISNSPLTISNGTERLQLAA
ncbi:MAG: ATPase, partial [Cellvibrio sp.]|nr:ATPase [Cellvibrio sp.]